MKWPAAYFLSPEGSFKPTEVKYEPRRLQAIFSEHLQWYRTVVYDPELATDWKYQTFNCNRFEEKYNNIAEKLRSRKAYPLSDNLKDNTHGLIGIYVSLEPWGPGRIVKTSSYCLQNQHKHFRHRAG